MKRSKRQHGFTLIEMMLAITILAMVMTSIGAAMDASLNSYRTNSDIAAVAQITRMVMSRMTREVRTAVDLDSTSTTMTITPPDNNDGITQIRYEYADSVLYRTQVVGGEDATQALIGDDDSSDIGLFSVIREDDLDGNPISVTIRMEVSVSGQEMSMTASACLRKQQPY